MDDRTLVRLPAAVTPPEADGIKVTPRCAACGTAVPDLSDPKHHVCVPDPNGAVVTAAGSFTKTTLDVTTAATEKASADLRAAEAAAAAAGKPVVP